MKLNAKEMLSFSHMIVIIFMCIKSQSQFYPKPSDKFTLRKMHTPQ